MYQFESKSFNRIWVFECDTIIMLHGLRRGRGSGPGGGLPPSVLLVILNMSSVMSLIFSWTDVVGENNYIVLEKKIGTV